MNLKCVTISWRSCFQFFGYIPRNGIAGSYGSSIFLNLLLFIYRLYLARCRILVPWLEKAMAPHSSPLVWKIQFALISGRFQRNQWHPTPVLLPGKSHGRRSLVGCSPWGLEESDTTELLPFHFSLSCIGEGNGNPLQCSCLENPRDRGAWWAAVYGVAQSQTRLKQLSSSLAKCWEFYFLKRTF